MNFKKYDNNSDNDNDSNVSFVDEEMYYNNIENDNGEDDVLEELKELNDNFNNNQTMNNINFSIKQHKNKISRPIPPKIDPKMSDFTFMQIDVDFDIYDSSYNIEKTKLNKAVLRMYGVTDIGNSVCLLIDNFSPYFYVKWINKYINFQKNKFDLMKYLNDKLKEKKGTSCTNQVIDLELVDKMDFKNFHLNKDLFLKITMESPKYLSSLREMFESGEFYNSKCYEFNNKTYESKLTYSLRYMIDNNIVGMSWITLPKDKYTVIENNNKISTCQIELNTSYVNIIAHPPENEYSKIAPIRVLSFDIEAAADKGKFPKFETDPVIQISNYCVEFGKNNNEPIAKSLFSYKKCAEIPGNDVYNFEKEDDMLRNWAYYILELDPDIITGYNINNFDFPYLFDRANHLGVKQFGKISRIKKTITKARRLASNSAKAFNNRELISINMDGRSIIDMYLIIVKDHKLRSNTLNNVSSHFLNEQKEDVHYSMIYPLWMQGEDSRKRLGIYCLKDAYLPWKLCEKLMIIYNFAEMCRVTCTPLNFILTRGQQIKVASQIHRNALMQGYVIPNEKIKIKTNLDGENEKGFEGAYVLDPITSFYREPIVTLDFASLYPSIMIAHNLCYTTLIPGEILESLDPSDYFTTPIGYSFVKPHVRKGILPIILEDLISARKKAKLELKNSKDEFERAVLDGRQLALKISANSVYGFTGAQVGQLPCLEISASVTSIGREMIDATSKYVESNFNILHGYDYDSKVVYGDTDSVMIKFGSNSLEEVMKLGKKASEEITLIFKKPIKLEFEKVYYPYLLMKKKRYAGLIWTKTDKYDRIDMKGLENVRRDNCELVKETLDKLLQLILLDKDGGKKAIDYVKGVISDLVSGKTDISKLIISKTISKKIELNSDVTKKNKKIYVSKQAHTELAEKMKKRDEGSAPGVGDRVAYVIVAGAKGTKTYQNSEDPRYVIDNDIPLDYKYYIENQLKKPVLRLLEHVVPNAEGKIFGTILNNLILIIIKLVGSHIVYKGSTISKNTMIGKFIFKRVLCLGCRGNLNDNNKAVCDNCISKLPILYSKQRLKVNYYERLHADFWTECQRCQGSLFNQVICQNFDCPIFFKRLKAKKDLTQETNNLIKYESHLVNW